MEGRRRSKMSHTGGLTAQNGALEGLLTRARIYRPSFRENMPKTLVFKTGSINSGGVVADSNHFEKELIPEPHSREKPDPD
jgi:hypothetical protein